MDAFARWLARHPLAVVVANLIVTAALGFYALQLRIENSLESMLLAGDPQVEYYNATRAIFGSDEVGVVGVRAADVFAPATLEKIFGIHATTSIVVVSTIDGSASSRQEGLPFGTTL